MTRDPVESSRISALGYDCATRVLEVEFKPTRDGRRAVWAYEDVDVETAEGLLNADSIGRAFSTIQQTHHGRRVAMIDADGNEHAEVSP